MANQLTVSPEVQAQPLRGQLMTEDTNGLDRGLLSGTTSEEDRLEARSAVVTMMCMMTTTASIVDAFAHSRIDDVLLKMMLEANMHIPILTKASRPILP